MSFSQSLTAAGTTQKALVKPGESVTYAVTGTFTGYVDVRISQTGGQTCKVLKTPAVDTGCTGTYVNETTADAVLYFVARDTDSETAMTGTAACAVVDQADEVWRNGPVTALDDGDVSLEGSVRSASNVGTAATGVTAVEYGDGYHHTTVLTVDTTLGAIAGGAALGLGKLIYTLPAGAQIVDGASMSITIQQTEAHITDDTPDVGLGTTVASGTVSTLDGTAAFENLITGQTATDCDGTATEAATLPTAGAALLIDSADDKTVYLNVADTWAASGDAAAALTGTVTISWKTLA
jgi:hypothetical protein